MSANERQSIDADKKRKITPIQKVAKNVEYQLKLNDKAIDKKYLQKQIDNSKAVSIKQKLPSGSKTARSISSTYSNADNSSKSKYKLNSYRSNNIANDHNKP